MGEAVSLPGEPRKNDDIFRAGSQQQLPSVHAYCQENTEVVHGPSCKLHDEICLEECRADGVPVVARRGGGGTVVLSPGMVITIVVGPRRSADSIHDIFSRVHRAMIGTLKPVAGLTLEEDGLSDLVVAGRKVLGSSLYLGRRPSLYYYQSSLMVDSDTSLMSRYLKYPPREPDYRGGRSHEEFCTTLRACGYHGTLTAVCDVLVSRLRDHLTREP